MSDMFPSSWCCVFFELRARYSRKRRKSQSISDRFHWLETEGLAPVGHWCVARRHFKISSSSSSLFVLFFFQKNIYFSCCVGHQQQHEMGHPIDYRLRVTFNSFPSTLYSRQEGRGYSIYIDLLFNLYIHSSSSVICSQKRSSNLFFVCLDRIFF